MLTYDVLNEIVKSVHARFTYVSDITNYNDNEYWISFDEIPDGDFTGDCEDFAQAVRKELSKISQDSKLAICGVNSKYANHAVCIYNDWVIDNIHETPVRKSELPSYTWHKISGFNAGDPWRKLT